MSSSFIEYRGFGFWSYDQYTESLIDEVATTISAQQDREAWLEELATHWKDQASGPFRAWMHLSLDDFLITEERRARVRDAVQAVTNRHSEDDPILGTGTLLVRLLDGDIKWDASSPLDYMVERTSWRRTEDRADGESTEPQFD